MADRPPIKEVLEAYYDVVVPTGFHGRAKMRCPVHQDRHASASVDHEKNRVRCFACGWAADSYDLIMENEGCDYSAAKQVAESNNWIAGSGLSGTTSGFGGSDGVSQVARFERRNSRGRAPRLRRRRRSGT